MLSSLSLSLLFIVSCSYSWTSLKGRKSNSKHPLNDHQVPSTDNPQQHSNTDHTIPDNNPVQLGAEYEGFSLTECEAYQVINET